MSYFIYTDLISSLLDLKLVDPGSALMHTALRLLLIDLTFTVKLPCSHSVEILTVGTLKRFTII